MTVTQMRTLMLRNGIGISELMRNPRCPVGPSSIYKYYIGKARVKLPDAFAKFLLEMVDERKDPSS